MSSKIRGTAAAAMCAVPPRKWNHHWIGELVPSS
jgi:hypothetical protein